MAADRSLKEATGTLPHGKITGSVGIIIVRTDIKLKVKMNHLAVKELGVATLPIRMLSAMPMLVLLYIIKIIQLAPLMVKN